MSALCVSGFTIHMYVCGLSQAISGYVVKSGRMWVENLSGDEVKYEVLGVRIFWYGVH